MTDETSSWTDGADLLLSPLGGGLLGWLWWTAMPKYAPIAGIDVECVDALGSTMCNPWAASSIGAVIAFLIAMAIHTSRS